MFPNRLECSNIRYILNWMSALVLATRYNIYSSSGDCDFMEIIKKFQIMLDLFPLPGQGGLVSQVVQSMDNSQVTDSYGNQPPETWPVSH